jgi:Zn-dependent peptidase ImmA (M78 family)
MMTAKTWRDADISHGERAARKLLDELGISHPMETSLENIAWLRGALVRDTPLVGAQGRSCRVGKRAIISVSDQIDYAPRRRYVIGHELGHLEIHKDENQLVLCESEQISEGHDNGYAAGTEREANAFASELLMPRALWTKRVDVRTPNLEVVSTLSNEFAVSYTAAAIRFAKLCPERCAAVFCQKNRVTWAAVGPDFGYGIRRDIKLSTYTLASDYFRKGEVGRAQETVQADAWIESRRLRDDHVLKEHCRAIPSIEATLSLLWVQPDAGF